jgi:hypothetical protein
MSRITRLEDAHRALAAQHTALLEVCRIFLPLISAPATLIDEALAKVRDRSAGYMTHPVMDEEYRASIQKWFDTLSAEIAAAHL